MSTLFGSDYGNSLAHTQKDKALPEASKGTFELGHIQDLCSDTQDFFNNFQDFDQDMNNNIYSSQDHGDCAPPPKFMLPNYKLEKNTVAQLQRWLSSRGISPVPRYKNELLAKVKDIMAKEPVLDPKVAVGKVCNEKQPRLLLTKDVARLHDDDVFPHSGWEVFPSRDMPNNFNFGSVFNHLVETMPQLTDPGQSTSFVDSSDEEEEQENVILINDPFEDAEQNEIKCSKKLRRGLQYVKSGYVRNVHDCLSDRLHCYKGQVRASMFPQAYKVKVAIFQVSGSVAKASCGCPQHTLQRCSHIGALLLFLLLHKNLNGPKAITCTSLPNVWNKGSLKRNPQSSKTRQYDSLKRDVVRRSTFDPRPAVELDSRTTHQKFMYLLAQLSHKKEPCLFQQVGSLVYEDFTFDANDLQILRTKVGVLHSALEDQVHELKPSPTHTGSFEVSGTKGQSSTDIWSRIRSLQCSAQPSRRIDRFTTDKARMNFLRRHLWGIGSVTTKGMAYGKKHESTARLKYAEEQRLLDPTVVVVECGLYLNTQYIGLSCSPDGFRKSQNDECKLLEIKVLYSLRKHDPNEFDIHLPPEKLANFCLTRNVDGVVQLRKNHAYYDQVQFSMGLLKLQECDFVVWTPHNIITLHIPFNEERWLELSRSALDFHTEYLLPEYFAMRTPRKLCPVRLE